MITRRKGLLGLGGLSLTTWAPVAISASDYPARAIRVYVPFPPGGGPDIIVREITQTVAAATGWTFVVENRPGAGGNFGVDAVAKAAPDGYSIVLGQTSNLAINPTLYTKMPYDVERDLMPVLSVAEAPLALVTAPTSQFKTMQQVLAAAKAKPGSINFASPGNGTVAHLAGELLQRSGGVKFQHIPYKGAAQALTDVMGGNVDLYMASFATLLGHIRQGKLRAIAVTSAKRVSDLPDTPTLAESGIKGAEANTWFGFLVPAKTPADVVDKLNAAFNKALKQPDFLKKLDHEGAEPMGGTPAEFAALIRKDTERWGRVVRDAGIRID